MIDAEIVRKFVVVAGNPCVKQLAVYCLGLIKNRMARQLHPQNTFEFKFKKSESNFELKIKYKQAS